MNILNQAALAGALAAACLPSLALADTMASHGSMAAHGAMSADCSKADAMMAPHEMSGHAMGSMKATGSVDKDFATAMAAHMPDAIAMAKMEAKCGKNAGEMKAAADLVNALQAFQKANEPILHTP